MIHQLQKLQHIVPIIQRLADAHEHDVGDLPSGVKLRKQHLIQHFRGRQIPHPSGHGGGAEGATHPAAHLRGDAHGVSVVVLHQHGLNAVPVLQFP